MIPEFIGWLLLTMLGSRILQSTFSLTQLPALIIVAPVAALIVSLVMFAVNSHFRKHAVRMNAHVDKILPPQRSGGLARVDVSVHQDKKVIYATLTPEVTPTQGDELKVWVCGRRILPELPTPGSDFRILAVCLIIAALAGLGYLCTLLLPDPTK